MKKFCLCMILLVCPITVFAQEVPELVTDRPDQTESSVVVPPRYFQVELGYTHGENDDDGTDVTSDSFPEVLLRIGLIDRLELRLGFSGYQWEDTEVSGAGDSELDGYGDTEVGAKLYLWEEAGFLPEAALMGHLSLPTGDDDFSSDEADPSFRFAFSHTLNETFSFGYNLGAAWETEEGESGNEHTLGVFQYTAVLGISVTDELGAFVEFYGDIPTSADGGPANSFDGGFTYLLADNLQLDVAAGVGLSEDAEDWFVGAGVSYRFPR